MEEAKNFSGSNVEPTKPFAPYPRMFWVTYFVGPVLFTPRGLFFLAYVVIMPKNAPDTIHHLINVLHNEVAKATETSQICLLKTASVTGKEYLLDLKTFLLLCLFTDQTGS